MGHTLSSCAKPLIGGAAIDETGTALPPETLAIAREADAVLLGAVGGPKWDDPRAKVRPEQGLLAIRKGAGAVRQPAPRRRSIPSSLHASPLRPELLAGVDMLVVRELTGGIYFGDKMRDDDRAGGHAARTPSPRSSASCARRRASRAGRRKKLTSVDKANVLETSRLWREVTMRVMTRGVSRRRAVAHAGRRVRDAPHPPPADFDVIVTENMFGDILTDEASMLAGSMGMLPSASLGEGKRGLYEPIHGSAPDIAGKGIANPYATILSVALLLRHSLGLETEARAVEAAVDAAIDAACCRSTSRRRRRRPRVDRRCRRRGASAALRR